MHERDVAGFFIARKADVVEHTPQIFCAGDGGAVGQIELDIIAAAIADADEFVQGHDGISDHFCPRGCSLVKEYLFHRLERLLSGRGQRGVEICDETRGSGDGQRPVVIGASVSAHAWGYGVVFHLAQAPSGVFKDMAHRAGHRATFRAQLPGLLLAGCAVNNAL